MNWRKSRYSSANGNCVEVANDRNAIVVHDTADNSGGSLAFTWIAWARFTAYLTLRRDVHELHRHVPYKAPVPNMQPPAQDTGNPA